MGNWTNRVYAYFENMETSNKLYELKQNDKIRYPSRQFDEDDGVADDNYERTATTVRFDSDTINRGQPRKSTGEAIQKKRKMSSLGLSNQFNNRSIGPILIFFSFHCCIQSCPYRFQQGSRFPERTRKDFEHLRKSNLLFWHVTIFISQIMASCSLFKISPIFFYENIN